MTVSKGPSEATLHPEGLLNPLAKSEKRWLDSVNVISFPGFLIPELLEGGFRSPRDGGRLDSGDVISRRSSMRTLLCFELCLQLFVRYFGAYFNVQRGLDAVSSV